MNEELIDLIDSLRHNSDSLLIHHIDNNFSNVRNLLTKATPWYSDPNLSLFATLLFGILGFIFFYLQSKQGDKLKNTVSEIKDETKNLQEIETNIESQVNRLADINRPFHKTFPEIMSTLQDIFQIAISYPDKSELYIMNRTSAFGKIHTYNPKFFYQYNINETQLKPKQKKRLNEYYRDENNILEDLTNIDDKCKYLFFEDVRRLYKQIEDCSKAMKNESFKIIVYDGETENHLKERFIEKYFEEVNSISDVKSNKGLLFFDFNHRITGSSQNQTPAKIDTKTTKPDASNKAEIEDLIRNEVIQVHNQVIMSIRKGKTECEDKTWLKYSNDIPMQMYLLKAIVNGKPVYHTFIINAMSSKSEGNPDRYVDGIYSREQSLYSVFKTLFDETFNKQ